MKSLTEIETLTGRVVLKDGFHRGVLVSYSDGKLRLGTGVVVEDEKVTVLPLPGEGITHDGENGFWLGQGEFFGYNSGISRVGPLDIRNVSRVVKADPMEGSLVTALCDARQELQAQKTKLEMLVEDAREYADANDLCGRFDDFLEEHGFEGRTREYTVCVKVEVEVMASDTDRAREEARELVLRKGLDVDEVYVTE